MLEIKDEELEKYHEIVKKYKSLFEKFDNSLYSEMAFFTILVVLLFDFI